MMDADSIRRNERARGEQGSALLVAVLLLIFMGVIGLSAMDTVTRDRQVAGFTQRTKMAFFAAEAGAHTGLELIQGANRFNPPALPATDLGNAADYPHANQPQFRGDPNITDPPIRVNNTQNAGALDLGFALTQGQGTGFVVDYWIVNAQGIGPNGGSARVEVAKRMLDFAGHGN